mgnify:CR=1 FL=1|tara:strand:- start:6037 stop:7425 length:1389 start_codon:yes stop_codon:yes gene_type:complete
MKRKSTQLTTLLLFFLSITLAQSNFTPVQGGGVDIPKNTEPCITEAQRIAVQSMIADNIAQLRAQGKLQNINTEGGHPLFDWPVAQASGHNYNRIWSVSNYIDHNPAVPNQISDYNCGTRSYDTTSGYNHQGFDIISWPFWWKQMDLDQAVNVAAADGQIVGKMDGSFDRNCTFNNDPWNAVFVQHSDGSVAWYLHMKNGGLTTKNIGDSVTQGEFLGVIGSSGSSTLPHLHFEVYDANNNLIDPSIGACNNWNNDTWWNDQKPYYDPGINAVLTHTAFPDFQTCPNTEITNESNHFALGETVYYGIYLKDQLAGANIHLKITRPDNTVQYEYDYAPADAQQIAYWMWNFVVDMEGTWTWEATYEGDSASHTFNVGVLGVEDNLLVNTTIYPNPFNDKIFIESEAKISSIIFRDVMGRIVYSESNTGASIEEIDMSFVAKGIYFATLTSEGNERKTIKLLKD